MSLKNKRVEFHILQSFPVSCLNRDDVGAPKTATVGGVTRARVSSQCWKREIRQALQDLGIKLGIRTKKLASLLNAACIEAGASTEQAELCSVKISNEFGDETLLFISETEVKAFAEFAKEQEFDASKLVVKALAKISKKVLNPSVDALDIALFGRMVAKASDMGVEAAGSFNHAISTHKVSNELDYFTAIDDMHEDHRSAHIGTLEFNSATYYRYISLDLGQLAQTFGTNDMEADADQIKTAIEAFVKAIFVAVPNARQNTQSGSCPWDFAKVLVRKGQGMQLSFETPVKPLKASEGGYLAPSITALKDTLAKKEAMYGSIFGKQGDFEWGVDEKYSIDSLIKDIQDCVE